MPRYHPKVAGNPLISSPEYVNVTPHNTTNLKHRARRVMCAVAGNISFQNEDAAIVIAVPANIPLDMEFDRINATSTTATGIVAWF